MFRKRTFRPKLVSFKSVLERFPQKLSNGVAYVYQSPNEHVLPSLEDYTLENLLASGQNLEYVNPTLTAKNSDVHLSETAASMVNNVSRETKNNNQNENGNS